MENKWARLLKDGVKKAIGKYSPPIYIEQEMRALLGGAKLKLVDVGGAVNLQPHWHKYIGNADYYIFEPDKRSYEQLVDTVDRYAFPEDFHYINKGLSKEGGQKTLYLTNVPTGSSLLKVNEKNRFHSFDNSYFHPVTETKIETVTLKDSLDEIGLDKVDAIKLDVQGAELDILKGMDDERMAGLKLIELEVGLHDVYEGQNTVSETQAFMEEKGFGLFDIRVSRVDVPSQMEQTNYAEEVFGVSEHSPSLASRVWELDMIFIREADWVLAEEGAQNQTEIAKLLACYCGYNFFTQAMSLVKGCLKGKKIDQKTYALWEDKIKKLQKRERLALIPFEEQMKKNNYLNWGQYMWVKAPSN